MTDRYPAEVLNPNYDDGTMPGSLDALGEAVIGHRIVSAERPAVLPGSNGWWNTNGLLLTLDNGTRVTVAETSDCCAFTDVDAFLLHPELVDHVITGVGTTDGFTTWHIYADAGDVLELTVGWSCGSPFYYGYGFNISVLPAGEGGDNG